MSVSSALAQGQPEIKDRVLITGGDPAGIGPELVEKAAAHLARGAKILYFCTAGRAHAQRVAELVEKAGASSSIDEPEKSEASVAIALSGGSDAVPAGLPSLESGRRALVALEMACDWIGLHGCRGLVTVPISKHHVNLALPGFLGHTEFLSEYFKRPVLMLMHGRNLSVIPITVHVPLLETASVLRKKMHDPDFLSNLKILAAWKELGPRWALCGLNPHAGEGGLLGTEELDFMQERADHWRREGLPVDGPLASDGIFQQFHSRRYRLVLAAYHDQGLIPFKALEGREGVNCTVGLPFVRTSPDHGTAFDLAGKGLADPSSFLAALDLVTSGGALWM